MPIVEVENLDVRHGDVHAVNGVSFAAEAGAVTAVLGPNGAGKTSTIDCLEGYRAPSNGTVRVCGLDPVRDHTALTRRIGVMLQAGGLHSAIRPVEALRLFAAFYDRPRDPGELLELVGLTDRARAPWRTLSGGEQQRLSLALAIIGRPDVVFLDEPTSGVDVTGRQLIRDLIRELRNDGAGVVLTSHDLAEVEEVADHLVIIETGRVIASGSVNELLASAADAVTFRADPGLDVASLAAAVDAPVAEVSPGSYRVDTAPSPRTVAAITSWLAERNLLIGDLSAGRERLESLFLRLVAEAEAEAEARPAGDAAQGSGRRGRRRGERSAGAR